MLNSFKKILTKETGLTHVCPADLKHWSYKKVNLFNFKWKVATEFQEDGKSLREVERS